MGHMINTNNIFRLLLLVSMTAFPFLQSSAEPNASNPAQPVWKDMKSSSDTDKGFVKPPPSSTKLTARIITDNATAIKGETLTFTLESNQSDLRFYWISNGQKSSKSTFIVDTGQLEVGKHRVRATITNRQRVQAHASLFFKVVEDPEQSSANSENSENSENSTATDNNDASVTPDNDGKVIELPAPSIDQPQTETTSDSGKVVELPVAVDVTVDNVDVNTDSPDIEDNSANDTQEDSANISISPQRQNIVKGGVAVFRSNVNADDGYTFKWKFTDQRSTAEQFEISSGNLEIGSYLVHLTTTDKENNEYKTEATLIINHEDMQSITVADYIGTKLTDLKGQLKEANLQLGHVSERVVEDEDNKQEIDHGVIIEQSLEAGSQVKIDTSIDVVVSKAPSKPLTVHIQPASLIVEQGKNVEFTAIFVDPEMNASDLSFSWTSANFDSQDSVFTIDTSSLSAGKYSVELQVKNTQGQQVSSAATYEITSKTIAAPDLTGKDIDTVRSLLEQSNLKLGDIQQRSDGDMDEGHVLEQTPAAGERIIVGNTVNITVASAKKKEVIDITLSVDKKTFKMGDAVTFHTKIEPEAKDTNIHYVYTMNAEKVANVLPTLQWKPNSEGIYSVTVTAYNDAGIIATSTPLSIDVTAAWELPVAKILPEMQVVNQGANAEFVSTATYDLNSSLNYEWSSETKHGGSKKQFMFDTTGIEPGTYTITLNVADDKNKKSSTTAMLVVQANIGSLDTLDKDKASTDNGSTNSSFNSQADPKAIAESATVTHADTKVHLSVSRQFVSTDSTIKIKVLTDESLTPESYYFESGDDQNLKWIQANEIEHTYNGFGTYAIRAAVKQDEKVYYSNSVTIWVWSSTLLFLTAGIGLLAYVIMWWWTKFIPKTKSSANDSSAIQPVVIEEQIPLLVDSSNDNDIVTDARRDDKRTVVSVLKKAIFQFVLGVGISILVLYVILKSVNLI